MMVSKVKVNVARVTFGTTKESGKPFACVEGLSSDIGLFKVYVPKPCGEDAQELIGYPALMTVEVYTTYDFKLSCRAFAFELDE